MVSTSPTNQRLSTDEYKRANPELSRHSSIRDSFRDTVTVTGDEDCDEVAENTGNTLRN